MKEYKPGTIIEYMGVFRDGISEDIIIIGKKGMSLSGGPLYDVYNITYEMFMERTQNFLDKYYQIVVE